METSKRRERATRCISAAVCDDDDVGDDGMMRHKADSDEEVEESPSVLLSFAPSATGLLAMKPNPVDAGVSEVVADVAGAKEPFCFGASEVGVVDDDGAKEKVGFAILFS